METEIVHKSNFNFKDEFEFGTPAPPPSYKGLNRTTQLFNYLFKLSKHCNVGAKAAVWPNSDARLRSSMWKYILPEQIKVSAAINKAALKYNNYTNAMHASSSKVSKKRQQSGQGRQTTIGQFSECPITDHQTSYL